MTIQQFIEAAIEGGYKFSNKSIFVLDNGDVIAVESFIIDPLAWQAVAKVKNWKGKFAHVPGTVWDAQGYLPGQYQQICMIEALWAGTTLEEYLATLE